MRPEWRRAARSRQLPPCGRGVRKWPHVHLECSGFVGGVGEPLSIGRQLRQSLGGWSGDQRDSGRVTRVEAQYVRRVRVEAHEDEPLTVGRLAHLSKAEVLGSQTHGRPHSVGAPAEWDAEGITSVSEVDELAAIVIPGGSEVFLCKYDIKKIEYNILNFLYEDTLNHPRA